MRPSDYPLKTTKLYADGMRFHFTKMTLCSNFVSFLLVLPKFDTTANIYFWLVSMNGRPYISLNHLTFYNRKNNQVITLHIKLYNNLRNSVFQICLAHIIPQWKWKKNDTGNKIILIVSYVLVLFFNVKRQAKLVLARMLWKKL